MNPSTLLGMIGGMVLLVSIIAFTSQDLGAFLNLPGLGIVLGGTLAATLMSYPLNEVLRVFRVFWLVLRNEHYFYRDDLNEIVEVSRLWFSGELAAADDRIEAIRNPFLRAGVQLVIDGTPLEDIDDFLQWRMVQLRRRENAEAQMFRSMALYAPAFGMLGTLVGLINMLLATRTDDFVTIAANLGVALITTFYGLILANLVFRPIAIKLERRTAERMILMNMVRQGVTLMRKGRSPAHIRETLRAFMAQHKDDLRTTAPLPGEDDGVTATEPEGRHDG
ncbi:motility protein A [Ectothiorhodospira mobilis]|uniref:motility protein A n=1 Tax=Ectothiorhodospira mobilis TaxID=195064 RepID=UPI001902C244|nr:MotA/TolQ/ExbB proton channel family protein [Ectothiorhodospira mobilis]MBK1691529.1 chemotaxis protein MotA [Ectothiorhodospira mobilis]